MFYVWKFSVYVQVWHRDPSYLISLLPYFHKILEHAGTVFCFSLPFSEMSFCLDIFLTCFCQLLLTNRHYVRTHDTLNGFSCLTRNQCSRGSEQGTPVHMGWLYSVSEDLMLAKTTDRLAIREMCLLNICFPCLQVELQNFQNRKGPLI